MSRPAVQWRRLRGRREGTALPHQVIKFVGIGQALAIGTNEIGEGAHAAGSSPRQLTAWNTVSSVAPQSGQTGTAPRFGETFIRK